MKRSRVLSHAACPTRPRLPPGTRCVVNVTLLAHGQALRQCFFCLCLLCTLWIGEGGGRKGTSLKIHIAIGFSICFFSLLLVR